MAAIGVDTHKATLAACAVDELGRPIGEATFANDPAGHDALIDWARSMAPEATIGIEGSSSFGAPLARSVQHAGLSVREVPPQSQPSCHSGARTGSEWASGAAGSPVTILVADPARGEWAIAAEPAPIAESAFRSSM